MIFFYSKSFCILISNLYHLVAGQQLGVILKARLLENGSRCNRVEVGLIFLVVMVIIVKVIVMVMVMLMVRGRGGL